MSDILERLRWPKTEQGDHWPIPNLHEDAADEIERLREALKPFITFVNLIDETIGDDLDELPLFTIDKNDFLDFLAAKAALEGK